MLSKERTGKDFKELHEWIDEPRKWLGKNHRIERNGYNINYEKYIRTKWGDLAVVEWLFHIAIDNLETANKRSSRLKGVEDNLNFIKIGLFPKKKFILFDFKKLDEDSLKTKFKDKYNIKNDYIRRN